MRRISMLTAAGALLFAAPAIGQEQTPSYIFGGYYRCNQATEARADEIVRGVVGPIIQKHVDAGHLNGWVWLSHAHGGAWRRVLATVGTDLGQMMDVREQVVNELAAEHPEAAAEFSGLCPSHDDYIWTSIATSTTDTEAVGSATFSVYYACDQSREGRTNQIFREVLAPLFTKHQEMGHLASWGYYGHRSGGIFRRLLTFSGADHKTLLEMQQAIMAEANETAALAMNEASSICNWHTDYMWNNATQP